MADVITQAQPKALVRRIESIEDEIKVLNEDKSDLYKEARGNGFDVKVLRKVIADRRKDKTEREEFETIYDLYWNAIHGVARAHVENIEEFDAETGEILDREPLPPEPAAQEDDVLTDAPGGSTESPAPKTAPVTAARVFASDDKPLRPHCLHPGTSCGGYGRNHCGACQRAMGASGVPA